MGGQAVGPGKHQYLPEGCQLRRGNAFRAFRRRQDIADFQTPENAHAPREAGCRERELSKEARWVAYN